jgi:hypothetical protein
MIAAGDSGTYSMTHTEESYKKAKNLIYTLTETEDYI